MPAAQELEVVATSAIEEVEHEVVPTGASAVIEIKSEEVEQVVAHSPIATVEIKSEEVEQVVAHSPIATVEIKSEEEITIGTVINAEPDAMDVDDCESGIYVDDAASVCSPSPAEDPIVGKIKEMNFSQLDVLVASVLGTNPMENIDKLHKTATILTKYKNIELGKVYKNHSKRWTAAQDKQLMDMYKSGQDISVMKTELQRTRKAILMRISVLLRKMVGEYGYRRTVEQCRSVPLPR